MALGAVLVIIGAVVAAAGTIGLMLPAIEAGFAAIGTTLAGVGSAVAAWFWPVTLAIGGVIPRRCTYSSGALGRAISAASGIWCWAFGTRSAWSLKASAP